LFGHCTTELCALHDVPDRYELSGWRDDKIAIHFSGTRRLETSIYPETIRIRFERADLLVDTYDQTNSRIIEHEKLGTPGSSQLAITPGTTDYDIRFRGINRDWVDSMQGKTRGYLTYQDLLVNSIASVRLHGHKRLVINPLAL
jgi:hypothetical protein